MAEWKLLTDEYPGWSIGDIKELSQRERRNWIEVRRINI